MDTQMIVTLLTQTTETIGLTSDMATNQAVTVTDPKQLDEFLTKNHATLKLLSKEKLYSALKSLGTITISQALISDYVQSKELHQIYKKPKKPKVFYHINAPPYSFQVDQIVLAQYASKNNNITHFVLLVDILSRKAFAYTLENNTVDCILGKLTEWYDSLDKEHKPMSISGDAFYDNDKVKAWCEDHFINLSTSIAKDDHMLNIGNKLGIVDRCTRTIKDMITKYMLANDDPKWTTYLSTIIDTYNSTPHRSLKNKTPKEVFEDKSALHKIFVDNVEHNKKVKSGVEFKVGDKVRVLEEKKNFAKEQARYSTQIYKIVELDGNLFRLQDEKGEKLERLYKFQEMTKVSKPPSDRIIRKKVDQARGMSKVVRRLGQEELTSPALVDVPKTVDEVIEASKQPRPKRQKRHNKQWWER